MTAAGVSGSFAVRDLKQRMSIQMMQQTKSRPVFRTAIAAAAVALLGVSLAGCNGAQTERPVAAKPAPQPSPAKQTERARRLMDSGQPAAQAQAAATLEPLARDGNPEAQYLLGFAYLEGNGVKRDPVRALNLFENAAVREHPQAAYLAAVEYDKGELAPVDRERAAAYMKIAADGGVVEALYLTAQALDQGDGLPRDREEALRYYELAAENGSLDATVEIARAYETGDGVPRDLAWALRWHERAAEYGIHESQHTFGTMIWSGNGYPVNQSEGLKWLMIAAQDGYRPSQRVVPKHRGRMSRADVAAARDSARDWQQSPEGILQGIDKATVRFVQAALNQMGIPSGGVDGKNGPTTRSAVNNFRLLNGLPQADSIDLDTVNRIREVRLQQTSRQARN